MSLQPMSDDRQQHLIKCAQKVIELMNISVKPDAALVKVAKDEDLNSNEVALVSHAVNNSKTLSHLAGSAPEDKGAPFTLTNAELANAQLNDSHPASEAKQDGVEKEAKKTEAWKKEAAASSLYEYSSYLDIDQEDHRPMARTAFGVEAPALPQAKLASVGLDDDLQVQFEDGVDSLKKIAKLARQAEAARTEASYERDCGLNILSKLAVELRRTDAPRWDRIEKLAVAKGIGSDTLDLIYGGCALEGIGCKRAGTEKLAGYVEASAREMVLVAAALQLESHIKRAGACSATQDLLQDRHDELEARLMKVSGTFDVINSEVSALPDKLTGAAYAGPSKTVELLGSAAGNMRSDGDEGSGYDKGDNTPLSLDARQNLTNVGGRQQIESLLGDEFIGKHPIPNVVDAFNRAMKTNPNLGEAELTQLVRQDLAGDGAPLDTLLRVGESRRDSE